MKSPEEPFWSPTENDENINTMNLGQNSKTGIQSALSNTKSSAKKITFHEDEHKRGRSNHITKPGILLRDRSSKFSSENPYSDQKVKTTYLWNNNTLSSSKGKNIYSNSAKKEIYYLQNKKNIISETLKRGESKEGTIGGNRGRFINIDPTKTRELQLIGNSIGRGNKSNSIFPRVTKTSDEVEAIERSLFSTSFQKKGKTKDMIKNMPKGLMEQLSTTVATTGHNTGLGWNQSLRGSTRKVPKTNHIKLADGSGYKYENKFFPRRNISSKLKYVHGFSRKGKRKATGKYLPKGYYMTKENNGNKNNLAKIPEKITGSVPSRTSTKLASSSYLKATPAVKKTYFSPGWKQTPNHQYRAHPPIYKR